MKVKVYETVKEIIKRNFGAECSQWFDFEIENNEKDFYSFSSDGKKVKIIGNSGLSLASGCYKYLTKYCNVSISEAGNNIKLPFFPPKTEKQVSYYCEQPYRLVNNYCTHSYTMAFWSKKEWQKELDFWALNGVNLVLDITGQELVWYKFLMKLGYTSQEALDFLVGPAYYAWFCMGNMFGYGGDLTLDYIEKRAELANSNYDFMETLGMQPILQGYSGMVPIDIKEKDVNAEVIKQGSWNHFRRPDMLKTNSSTYEKYSKLFYETQIEVLGNRTSFFSTDPFHEGGKTGFMSPKVIAENIMKNLISMNPHNIWVVQSWGKNPRKGLLKGCKPYENNLLVLDLYAEKHPRWKRFRGKEFKGTPWIYCMLNNFGGRVGLHGHIDSLVKEIPLAQKTATHLKGVGFVPEASGSNPILTKLLFDLVWINKEEPFNFDPWLNEYISSRYGYVNENLKNCFDILINTVYKKKYNNSLWGQGAAECIFNSRPKFKIGKVCEWGTCKISYNPADLEEALRLFEKEQENLKACDAYLFDLVDFQRQVISNKAIGLLKELKSSYERKNIAAFQSLSSEFLSLMDQMDSILSTRKEFSLKEWLTQAQKAANGNSTLEKTFTLNAITLITTWGDEPQSEDGKLHDYSNRQWSGLLSGLYKKRWELWLFNCLEELKGRKPQSVNWYQFDKNFIDTMVAEETIACKDNAI